MGFQAGNQLQRLANHQNPKVFQNALKISIQRAKRGTPQLQRIANKLADLAEEGCINAIVAVADRLDGRPDATLHTTGDNLSLFEAILDAIDQRRRAALNGDGVRTIEHEPAKLRNGHSKGGA